jgi:tRNA(adenine34) deaminase
VCGDQFKGRAYLRLLFLRDLRRHGDLYARARHGPAGAERARIIAMDLSAVDEFDRKMMERCLELSRVAATEGEYPFAAVICRNGEIVVEATNRVVREKDVTRHCDLVAVSEAQKVLGKTTLDDCTIYTIGEPCPLCSYAIRESRIGKVVYGFRSPLMGGVSRWNILTDEDISNAMPEVFAAPPVIVAGLLRDQAEDVWMKWNPVIWGFVRLRGCFGGDPTEARVQPSEVPRRRGLWRRLVSLFR